MSDRFRFDEVDATDYDDLRPGYAAEAVAWVMEGGGLRPGSVVVDLAAGTGQLSKHLVASGVEAIAIEPAANMRAVVEARLPSVRALDGHAESLPLDDGSVDAVVVGNAFHHFDRDAAFAEIRRVVRRDGTLALFWAWPLEEEEPRAIPGIEEIYEVVGRYRAASAIIAAYRSWAEPPVTVDGFEPFERREFPFVHELPSARLADLYATSSDIASLPRDERGRLLERIREISRTLPDVLRLPSRTVVDVSRRTI
jgi:SAM-dependent methyltransferase